MTTSKRVTLALFVLSLLAFLAVVALRVGEDRRPVPVPVAQATVPVPTTTPSAEPTATHTSPVPAPTRYALFFPGIGSAQSSTPTAAPTPVEIPTATPVPPPTPTPVIPWPDALAAPGRSKLGLHVQWNNSPEIMEFIRRMKPAVIKAIDDLGFVAEAKEASPETIIVARITHAQPMEGDAEAMARAFVADNLSTYLEHPAVDYWEGYNEPPVGGRMDWYARFEAERVRAMAEHGLRAAIGSFSTGVPEFEDWQAFLPAIRAAAEHGGVLALHEYDAPDLNRSVGYGLPGHPARADRGSLALRYRWLYEDILGPASLVIPLVISEAGVDGLVTDRPGPADAHGFRDFFEYWRQRDPDSDPLYVYLDQLAWYDRQVQQDGYVIGFALFTAGALDDRWDSYDVTGFLRHIAQDIIVPQAN